MKHPICSEVGVEGTGVFEMTVTTKTVPDVGLSSTSVVRLVVTRGVA